MARDVSWLVYGSVDVTAHDAVEISPSNNNTKGYTATIDAFKIVTRPRDCVGNAGIDAYSTEEGSAKHHQ